MKLCLDMGPEYAGSSVTLELPPGHNLYLLRPLFMEPSTLKTSHPSVPGRPLVHADIQMPSTGCSPIVCLCSRTPQTLYTSTPPVANYLFTLCAPESLSRACQVIGLTSERLYYPGGRATPSKFVLPRIFFHILRVPCKVSS